jgi:predicted NBD/HSP70 family sugar kinase
VTVPDSELANQREPGGAVRATGVDPGESALAASASAAMPSGPTTPGHLLSLIRSRPVWTRQQLLAVTGMSRTTLFERLDVLFRHRLVYEAGSAGSDGGRPATLLRFDDRDRVALVFDLGQTHARIGVADLSGRTRRMTEQQLDITEPPQWLLPRLLRAAAALLDAGDGEHLAGIGMSVPGPVGAAAATLGTSTTMPEWVRYPIADVVRERWPVPVLIENDARAFALGESTMIPLARGAALLAVKFASGIGSGIVLGGEAIAGVGGAAGDIGHIRVSDGGPACLCGRRGCLAAWASGRALLEQLRPQGVRNLRDLAERVDRGDPDVNAATARASEALGRVLAAVIAMVNPQILVLGGTLGRLAAVVTAVERQVRATALDRVTVGLSVVPSRLGDEAVSVGLTAMLNATVFAPDVIDALVDGG